MTASAVYVVAFVMWGISGCKGDGMRSYTNKKHCENERFYYNYLHPYKDLTIPYNIYKSLYILKGFLSSATII